MTYYDTHSCGWLQVVPRWGYCRGHDSAWQLLLSGLLPPDKPWQARPGKQRVLIAGHWLQRRSPWPASSCRCRRGRAARQPEAGSAGGWRRVWGNRRGATTLSSCAGGYMSLATTRVGSADNSSDKCTPNASKWPSACQRLSPSPAVHSQRQGMDFMLQWLSPFPLLQQC